MNKTIDTQMYRLRFQPQPLALKYDRTAQKTRFHLARLLNDLTGNRSAVEDPIGLKRIVNG